MPTPPLSYGFHKSFYSKISLDLAPWASVGTTVNFSPLHWVFSFISERGFKMSFHFELLRKSLHLSRNKRMSELFILVSSINALDLAERYDLGS